MRTRIFFYGLFMDRALLERQGLHPEPIGPAVLPDYRIHIGERATLLPAEGERAYGIVMALSDTEASALYAEPSVRAYRPERVRAVLLEGDEVVEADCYNLPPELGLAGSNPAYATKLSRLVERLGFDAAYVREISAFGEPPEPRDDHPTGRRELDATNRRRLARAVIALLALLVAAWLFTRGAGPF